MLASIAPIYIAKHELTGALSVEYGGHVTDFEDGGQVQGPGSVSKNFLQLAVDAQLFEFGG